MNTGKHQQSDDEPAARARANGAPQVRLVGASRGDPLTRYLFDALDRRYGLVGRIDTDLRPWQRYLIGASTFHLSRAQWKERFWKSSLAFRVRSRNSRAALEGITAPVDAVVQVHALFRTQGAPYTIYIDNTHHQSVQGWPAWNPFTESELERWYAQERATYRQAAHLFTMGEAAAESLRTFYGMPTDRVTNVGGGANFDTLPPLTDTPRQPIILFVGHDFHRKGGMRLVEAFRLIRERMPAARLQIVGSSAVASEQGIEVLGRINDRQRLAQLYAQASIFCLPSYFDPYGMVLIEAMAYGLPCVSTAVCSIPEIVGDGETGLLVPPGESAALAGALLRLLEDPAYAARLGAAGRRRVEQQLNWDRVVDRMDPALSRLAGPGRVPAGGTGAGRNDVTARCTERTAGISR